MLGEYVKDKKMGKLSGGDGVMSQNEDQLLSEPINND